MDVLAGLLLGVGLSAATGFRLFVPPLVLSIASLYLGLPLPHQIQWLATDTAFYILLVATVMETGAYYVPWLDNLLDTIATPAAVVAGTLITSPFIGELDPFWRWTLALVAGGAAAGAVQSLTGATRLTSTATTAGLANPLVATLENLASVFLSITVIVFPLMTVVVLGLLGFVIFQITGRVRKCHLPEIPPPAGHGP